MIFFLLALVPFLVLVIIVAAIVTAAVLWRRRDTTTDPGIGTVKRLYFYTVSFVALMVAANGVVLIVEFILEGLFRGPAVVSPSSIRLAAGLSMVVAGLPLWFVHWTLVQRQVRRLPVETRSIIRKLYMYAILGVAVGFTIAASVQLIEWIFRAKDFNGYPWGAVITWGAIWAFHWRLESDEGQPTVETMGIRRLYIYVVSLASLTLMVMGLGRAMQIVLIEGYDALVSTAVFIPSDSNLLRDATRSALALGLVGGVVWVAHWIYLARNDYDSVLRRVYLYIFAILSGVITALVSLGFIVNGVLSWLLDVPTVDTTATLFRFLPGAITGLSIGVGLWLYHWSVVRRDAEFSHYESVGTRRIYIYVLAAIGLVAMLVAIGTLVNTSLSILIESTTELFGGADFWRKPIALTITLLIIGVPIWGYYWNLAQRRVLADGAEERNALPRRVFLFAALGAGVLALLGSVSGLIFVFLNDLLGAELGHDTLRDIKAPINVVAAAAIFLPYFWFVYRADRRVVEPEEPLEPERPVRKEVTVLAQEGAEQLVARLEGALGYRVSTLRWADANGTLPELSDADCEELARQISDATGARVLLIAEGPSVRVLSYN